MEIIKNKTHDILRWSEKYTKTDMVYLVSGGFWLFIQQVSSLAIGFLINIIFANTLSPETYGNYKYIISFASIASAFSLTGIGNSLAKSIAQGYDGSFYVAIKESVKWSMLPSIILIFTSLYYFLNENKILSLSFLIISLIQPIIISTSLYGYYYNGKGKFYLSSISGIIFTLFTSTSIIISLLLTNNIIIIVATNFISTAIISVILYLYSKKYIVSNEVDPNTIPYSKHLSIVNLVNTFTEKLDSILLFTLLGGTQLAVYIFALLVPEQIISGFKNINTLAFPKLSVQSKSSAEKSVYAKTKQMLIYILISGGLYILFAPLLFNIFFPVYKESIFISQIYTISILGILTSLPITAMTSLGSVKELHKINTYGSIIQIILLGTLIYSMGLWGAVIARIIYRLIKIPLSFFYFRKYCQS